MAEEEKEENEEKKEEQTEGSFKEKEEQTEGSFKEKVSETFSNIGKDERIENIVSFAKSNTRDTLAYVILFLGILFLLFRSLWGGFLIGVVGGIYFSDEIWGFARNINAFIEEYGMVRALIFGGVALGLFIEAPMIFIGAALAIVIKQMVMPAAAK